jgi:hypothetical protein
MAVFPLTMLKSLNSITSSSLMPGQKTIPALISTIYQTAFSIRMVIGMMGWRKVTAPTATSKPRHATHPVLLSQGLMAIRTVTGNIVFSWSSGKIGVYVRYAQYIMALGITITLVNPVEIAPGQVGCRFTIPCPDNRNSASRQLISCISFMRMAPHAGVCQESSVRRRAQLRT